MNGGFWDNLPKPFFTLAPMADVTDAVFRQVIAEIAKPNVFFTEFTSADGLSHVKGREKLLINFRYSELERPIVAQIFGSRPENIHKAAALCKDLGFDGVDINMGCPDKKVEKQGAGSALIKTPKLALEIIDAALEGCAPLPVSVKTRLGYNEVDLAWLEMLMNTRIAALTVHLRTRKEMSKVGAHWELAGELRKKFPQRAPSEKIPSRTTAELLAPPSDEARSPVSPRLGTLSERARNGGISHSLLIANGDVEDMRDAREKAEKYNLDGIMLGRAIFGNPWLFLQGEKSPERSRGAGKPPWPEVFATMIHHSNLFEKEFTGIKSFAVMRKFFGAYLSGHPRATELKIKLMTCDNAHDVEKLILGI